MNRGLVASASQLLTTTVTLLPDTHGGTALVVSGSGSELPVRWGWGWGTQAQSLVRD